MDALEVRLKYGLYALFLLFFLAIPGCKREIVPEPYLPTNAHAAYLNSLEQANLTDTALGRDWISASKEALLEPVDISPPFKEVFYVDSAAAFAVGYRFDVKRGQRIELEIGFQGQQLTRFFIDLFRVNGESTQEWVLVASSNQDKNRLEFEPRRDAPYVVRLQSELLRGGQFQVLIRNVASLDFPVSGRNSRSIQSGFGAPRDAGRRVHHGVDIFAPRHTPVFAPSKAYVRFVGEQNLGGRTVWLYDSKRSLHLYFAHLQRQDVEQYTNVEAGQIIGTVGNSGNARTTAPHLHFGIYVPGKGPVDPYHFISKTNVTPAKIEADLKALGYWVRAKIPTVVLKSYLDSRSREGVPLEQNSPMKVLAAAGNRYRIQLPDGVSGCVPAGSVTPAEKTLHRQAAFIRQTVKETPAQDATTMEWVRPGEEFFILGRYEEYWLVRTQQGSTGWMQITQTSSSDSR